MSEIQERIRLEQAITRIKPDLITCDCCGQLIQPERSHMELTLLVDLILKERKNFHAQSANVVQGTKQTSSQGENCNAVNQPRS